MFNNDFTSELDEKKPKINNNKIITKETKK